MKLNLIYRETTALLQQALDRTNDEEVTDTQLICVGLNHSISKALHNNCVDVKVNSSDYIELINTVVELEKRIQDMTAIAKK